jgi:hypothetical protein
LFGLFKSPPFISATAQCWPDHSVRVDAVRIAAIPGKPGDDFAIARAR